MSIWQRQKNSAGYGIVQSSDDPQKETFAG